MTILDSEEHATHELFITKQEVEGPFSANLCTLHVGNGKNKKPVFQYLNAFI
jgi:hypothetical protein